MRRRRQQRRRRRRWQRRQQPPLMSGLVSMQTTAWNEAAVLAAFEEARDGEEEQPDRVKGLLVRVRPNVSHQRTRLDPK